MVSTYPTQKGGLGGGYSFGTPISISDVRGGGAVPYFRGGPTQFRPPANKGGYRPPKPANEASRNWWHDLNKALALTTAAVLNPGTTILVENPIRPFGAFSKPRNWPSATLFSAGLHAADTAFHLSWPDRTWSASSSLNPSLGFHGNTTPDVALKFVGSALGGTRTAAVPAGHWLWGGHTDRLLPNPERHYWQWEVQRPATNAPWPPIWNVPGRTFAFPPSPMLAPSADPWLIPILTPIPGVVAVPFPLTRNAPGTVPLGDPAYNGEPSYGVVPVPFGSPGTVIVYGPNGATASAPGMIPRRPPPKNERERKTNPVAAWVYAGLSFVTESTDAVDAVWKALPGDAKTRIKGQRTTPQQKLEDIINGLDRLDVSQAVVNLILEALEDRLWAAGGKLTKQANQRDGKIPGWASGPAI